MQQTTHFKPISSPQLLHLHWIMKLLWSKKNSWRKIIWPRNMYIINPGSAIVGETIPLYFCGLHEVTVSIHPALAYFLLQVTHFLARWTLIKFLQPLPSSSSNGSCSTPSSSLNHSPVSAPVSRAAQSYLPGQSICAGIGTPVRSPPGPGLQAPKRQQVISMKCAEHI